LNFSKFLARGFKVGRVDQEETALGAEMRIAASRSSAKTQDSGKKIVRRALNKVLTLGTLVDGNLLSDDHASHCVSIVEKAPDSKSCPTFGIAILDASISEVNVGFWEDDICCTKLETAIRQLRIKEIVFSKVCTMYLICR
jgi:DNA mismatch repair protein MSH6